MTTTLISWLDSPRVPSVGDVGGKGRSLHILRGLGMQVPEAFVVTASAYRAALPDSVVREIGRMVAAVEDSSDIRVVDEAASWIRERVCRATDSDDVDSAIRRAYARLADTVGDPVVPVVVRSSSVAEDSKSHSFAGEHDSYFGIVGPDAVCDAVRRCWASLFTARAMAYRLRWGLTVSEDAMAVVVQQMVDAERAGVFVTLNPINGDRSKIVIESVWGLGEPLMNGSVTPDRIVVDKVTREVLEHSVATKTHRAVRDPSAGRGIVLSPVDGAQRNRPALSPAHVDQLVDIARAVEIHAGSPQDGEFAIDGTKIYLLQARPETVWSHKRANRPRAAGTVDAVTQVVNALTDYGDYGVGGQH